MGRRSRERTGEHGIVGVYEGLREEAALLGD